MTLTTIRKSMLATAALGMLATSVGTAGAVPAPRIIDKSEISGVTVVRDGCGFRRHFDRFLRRCVWDRHHHHHRRGW